MNKPIIYVAGKYRGASESEVRANIEKARAAAEAIWKAGGIALCPHMNTAFMGGIVPDKDFLDGDLQLMAKCDAVYAIIGWTDSAGSRVEVEEALAAGMPVGYQYDNFCGIGQFVNSIFAGNKPAVKYDMILKLMNGWDKPLYGCREYVILDTGNGNVYVVQCADPTLIFGPENQQWASERMPHGHFEVFCADNAGFNGRVDPQALRVFMEGAGINAMARLAACEDRHRSEGAEKISMEFEQTLRVLRRLPLCDMKAVDLLKPYYRDIIHACGPERAREIGERIAKDTKGIILDRHAGELAELWWNQYKAEVKA